MLLAPACVKVCFFLKNSLGLLIITIQEEDEDEDDDEEAEGSAWVVLPS